jgi:hypothetical protein
VNAPIDRVHADSIEAVERIRTWFAVLHAQVATWQPRPLPPVRRDQPAAYNFELHLDGTLVERRPVVTERPANRSWFRSLR